MNPAVMNPTRTRILRTSKDVMSKALPDPGAKTTLSRGSQGESPQWNNHSWSVRSA
jgi:hypothetical protein